MIRIETDLKKYLMEKHKEVFPFFSKMEFETPIDGVFSNKRIGLVDMTFKYGQRWYACEIKYYTNPNTINSDFWASLKVIGYAHALSMIYKQHFNPIIMIPKKILSNDVLAIIGKLGIDYIAVYHNGKNELRFEVCT